ncbi:hypothetical protein [Actinoallomurus sp. NPDC050550]|uniref:hypothetical protein n=1 Tax=Actinoallomurus sp. NPDC050550 TaxID=3154937 RepID=UPI0033F9D7C4
MSPRAAGYGETQPRLDDDRLPVVLVILDGLGDRPVPELGGRTPAEAAHTPMLDALARRGASAWHLPFGWGRAPSSELAHWAIFGYHQVPFPGRAVIEALGGGIEVPYDVPAFHACLRTSTIADGKVWITGRAAPDDADDVAALTAELAPVCREHGVGLHPLPPVGRGEALLITPDLTSADVTDSDPFFENRHPWLRPRPTAPEGTATAEALTDFLLACRRQLTTGPTNAARRGHGRPALDVLTTKWAGIRRPVPGFTEWVGVPGAAVTSTRLYRGLAALLSLRDLPIRPRPSLERDLADRVDAALGLLDDGAAFVHIHTKATDDAGHRKQPYAKRDVLEQLDAGLTGLLTLADRAVVAVTGDHATPSTGGVLHTGDPTPFVVAGPTVRPDSIDRFGENWARAGDYGIITATDLLPILFGHANRPAFLGHRPAEHCTIALPDDPMAMPAD